MKSEAELTKEIEEKAETVAEQCARRGVIVSTAESCTGGGIAQCLTEIPGSSAWFDSGFVTYSNEAKQRMLGVPSELLEPDGPGAVSEETVRAMTAGAMANSSAHMAIGVTGIAGPTGGSDKKPVGTVWVAWQLYTMVQVQQFRFPGNRRQVRLATVNIALDGILDIFSQYRN